MTWRSSVSLMLNAAGKHITIIERPFFCPAYPWPAIKVGNRSACGHRAIFKIFSRRRGDAWGTDYKPMSIYIDGVALVKTHCYKLRNASNWRISRRKALKTEPGLSCVYFGISEKAERLGALCTFEQLSVYFCRSHTAEGVSVCFCDGQAADGVSVYFCVEEAVVCGLKVWTSLDY